MIFQAEGGRSSFRKPETRFVAELDVILTDAFLTYASHLADGMVNPEMSLADGNSARQGEGLAELLEQALASNQVGPALQSLRPQHEFYLGLRQALRERRERLCGTEGTPDTPDEGRARPGLDPFRNARTEIQDEIRTIILNMERWRWLPRFLGRRFVLIDVAGFRLIAAEDGRRTMSMKVVVGNLDWPTPVLSALITGFILNPNWNCPKTIFYKEIINYIKADRNYLSNNKMVILEGWGSRERELDAGALDWAAVNPSTYPVLHLRQLPGPANILGRLKFVMPNDLDIYLHDTPYQEDFKQKARIFSHGCIRAEKPFDLAARLARSRKWTKADILAVVQGLEETKVVLADPVPIHVNYCTAWPGEDGRVEFRSDVYGWDRKLAEVFRPLMSPAAR
jgi:murein L,D-transpeptidase YcbB/YkuD